MSGVRTTDVRSRRSFHGRCDTATFGRTSKEALVAKRSSKTPKSKAKKAVKKAAAAGLQAEVTRIASAAERRAEELLSMIERRKETIAESFYDIGKALQELLKKKLYAALGYASFDEMLRERSVLGVT